MAQECIVFKLKGVVDNDDLKKFGEIRLSIDNSSTSVQVYRITLANTESIEFNTLDSNSYFTNSTGSTNLGSTIVKPIGSGELNIRIPAGETAILSFNPLYSITNLGLSANTPFISNNINAGSAYRLRYNISDFKYMTNAIIFSPGLVNVNRTILTGKLEDLPNAVELQILNLGGSQDSTNMTGDVSDLPTYQNLTYLSLNTLSKITGTYTDLVQKVNSTELTSLLLQNTQISGDLNILNNIYNNLSSLRIEGTPKTVADLSEFNIFNNLKDLGITADQTTNKNINLVPNTIDQLRGDLNNQTNFIYTTPTTQRSAILSLLNVRLTNIDQFLIDMAILPASTFSNKTINVYGTRTSISNDAVTTIKGKGYSVLVNGTTL